jgi:drug/metabolite transporter (DMT)-like permease
MHWVWLIFQASVVVAGGFVTWLWLLSVYPTSTVASFSFLTPILSIVLGHLLFGEVLSITLLGAATLVSLGIVLINQKAR